MNWLDIVLGLILLASILSSFRKGLSREIIGLASVLLALVLGVWFYGNAAGYLGRYITSPLAADFVGFALVFCGVLLIGGLLGWIVGKFLRISGFSFLDHILGMGFGLLRGVLIGVALITGIMAFSPADQPPGEVVHSRLAPYLVSGSRAVAAIAPHELKTGFRKNYERVEAAWERATQRPGSRGGGEE
ncbi:MAG TPA: CvpA family protein [Bryobacteraceae bacterium]|nr:CvpA family protein [Bryobacteraceae bacterium]